MIRYAHTALVIIQTALIIARNLYIAVMFLPLWLWSAAYRYEYEFPSVFRWLDASWNVFSVFALLYGAFGLWFFAEKAAEAHYSGRPSKSLTISVWAIAVTLFVACLGVVIDRGRNGWGSGLFLIGIDALPLILLFCIQAYSLERKKAEEAEHEKPKPDDMALEQQH